MTSTLTPRVSGQSVGGVPVNGILEAIGELTGPGLIHIIDADEAEAIPLTSGRLSLVKDTVAAVQALTTATYGGSHVYVSSYHTPTTYADERPHGGGWFFYDSTDTTSADNGGTILVDASSRRWKRSMGSVPDAAMFGCVGDGTVNDTTAWNRCVAAITANTIKSLYIPTGFNILVSTGLSVLYTTDNWTIWTDAPNAATITMASDAGTSATFFRLGDASNDVRYATIRNVGLVNANKTSITSGSWQIECVNAVRPLIIGVVQDGAACVRLGSGDTSVSCRQAMIVNAAMTAYKAVGEAAISFENCSGNFLWDVRIGSSSGTPNANFRFWRVRPPVGGNIDVITMDGVICNETGNDVDIGAEIDSSYSEIGSITMRRSYVEQTRVPLHVHNNNGYATVTISDASPAVITWTGHPLIAGSEVQFSTSGALPTGITAGTSYYVIATGLTANEFQISATVGGAAINTSSAGSGTHTCSLRDGFLGGLVITDKSRLTAVRTTANSRGILVENSNNTLMDIRLDPGCSISAGNGRAILFTGDATDSGRTVFEVNGCDIIDRRRTGTPRPAIEIGASGFVLRNCKFIAGYLPDTYQDVVTAAAFSTAVTFTADVKRYTIEGNDFRACTSTPAIDATLITGTGDPAKQIVRGNIYNTPTQAYVGSTALIASPALLRTIPLVDNSVVHVEARVMMMLADGSQRASYTIAGTFYRDGGSATQQGTTTYLHSAESDVGFNASFSVSGNNVEIYGTTYVDSQTRMSCDVYVMNLV